MRALVPGMLQRRHGVVGYLASGFRMSRGGGSYFAIKAATSAMMMSLAAELGEVQDTGVGVFMLVPGNVVEAPEEERSARQSLFAGLNVGYEGPMSPEDSGAALAYAIVHAAEIHGSGVTTGQVQKQMGWPFPNPELVPARGFRPTKRWGGSARFRLHGSGFFATRLLQISAQQTGFRGGRTETLCPAHAGDRVRAINPAARR